MQRQPLYQPHYYQDHSSAGVFIAGMLFALLVTLAIIGVILLLKKNKGLRDSSDTELSAIVRTRYANGEIDKEHYDQLIADLSLQKPKSKQSDKKEI